MSGMRAGAAPRYALIQRALHWLIALMAVGVLGLGLTLDAYGFDGLNAAFGIEITNMVFKYHKTLGVLILAAMAARIAARLAFGAPPYAAPLTRFERTASRLTHGLLYLGLVAMPVLGWSATAASGFPVEFFNWRLPGLIGVDKPLGAALYTIHGAVAWGLIALIVLHVAAATMHGVVKRDGVLSRML